MTTNGPERDEATGTDWQACPAGELSQLAGRLRARRRNVEIRRALKTSLVAASVFAAAVTWYAFSQAPNAGGQNPPLVNQPKAGDPQLVARISCNEVRERTMDFVTNKVDGDLRARIEKHLGKCGSCAKFVREHRPTALRGELSSR